MEYSLWLYGSQARGDDDEFSDRDLLLVGPETARHEPDVSDTLRRPTSLSRYEWPEIEQMAEYGSLFLVHLRSEGVELSGTEFGRKRLHTLLGTMPEYRHATRDIRGFRTLLDDVRRSLDAGGSWPFELATLGGMIRHASVLACYLTGPAVFGRIAAIRTAGTRLAMEETFAPLFVEIYAFHMWAQGRRPRPIVRLQHRTTHALALAESFLSKLEKCAT